MELTVAQWDQVDRGQRASLVATRSRRSSVPVSSSASWLLLPGSVGKHIHAYLPTVAGQQIVTTYQTVDAFLSPWQGFGVFCAWTALLLLVAGYGLKRRDA